MGERLINIFKFVVVILCVFIGTRAQAVTSITTADITILACSYNSSYQALGNIVFREGANGDWTSGNNQTIIITAPANFEFQAGVGTAAVTNGSRWSLDVCTVTASTITIQYDQGTGGGGPADEFTISGIFVRATAADAGTACTVTGGTYAMNGIANGDAVGTYTATTVTSALTTTGAGNWSAGATWTGGVAPSADCQGVTISHAVTLDVADQVGDITIASGGTLTASNLLTVTGTFTIANGGTYVHSHTSDPSTTTFGGTESFGATSTFKVTAWHDGEDPLGQYASAWGNVEFNNSAVTIWNQDGTFAPNKIKGYLWLSGDDEIRMDDGTGMTTALTIDGNVSVTGGGNFIGALGADRNLTFTCADFVVSNGGSLNSISAQPQGTINWIVNGNCVINDDFSAVQGSSTDNMPLNVTVTGNMDLTGGWIDFNEGADGDVNVNVGGTFTNAATDITRFINQGNDDVTLIANAMVVSGGTDNDFQNGGGSGNSTFTIATDLTISGGTSNKFHDDGTGNFTMTVGDDLIISGGTSYFTYSLNGTTSLTVTDDVTISTGFTYQYLGGGGACTIDVNGDYAHSTGTVYGSDGTGTTSTVTFDVAGTATISGDAVHRVAYSGGAVDIDLGALVKTSTGDFHGQYNTNNSSATTMDVTGNMDLDAGETAVVYEGGGTAALTVGGNLTMDGASTDLWVSYTGSGTSGDADLTVTGNFDFAGRYFFCLGGSNTGSVTTTGNIGGNLDMTFTTDDIFRWSRFAGNNNSVDLDVGGNMEFSGASTGVGFGYIGNLGTGAETVDIVGNLNCDGGDNVHFGGYPSQASDHTTTVNITGNLTQSAGTITCSAQDGVATWNVLGGFTMSGGTLHLRNGIDENSTNNITTMSINSNDDATGAFSHTGGTINFDSRTGSTTTSVLNILSPTITMGGTGAITHASAGTGTVFGTLNYTYTGTSTIDKATAGYDIQQVKQIVETGTTLNASGSTEDLEVCSHSTAATTYFDVDGILILGTKHLQSNATTTNSGMMVSSGGEVRTAEADGFYDGTANAAVEGSNNMNYDLDANSTITYNGTGNQACTHYFNTSSTTAHKYGILKIDNTGTNGTHAVSQSQTGYVRTTLILNDGEYFLNANTLEIETATNGAITSTANGWIESEHAAATSLGIVKWKSIATTGVDYVWPFGVDGTKIPFTMNFTTASGNDVSVVTRATAASDNAPLTTGVTHTNGWDVAGDNSTTGVIDRWWDITATGHTANLTFSYLGSENTTEAAVNTGTFEAQHWDGTDWEVPVGTGTGVTSGVGTVTANGQNDFSPWLLVAQSRTLPIELLSFDAKTDGEKVNIDWSTITEIDNDYFTIQKSKEGAFFADIGTVNGAGNSNEQLDYTLVDDSPYSGISYYRLKQTDYDGKFTYSDIKTVRFSPKTPGIVRVFPNPADRNARISLELDGFGADNEVLVVVTDIAGRTVYSKVIVTGKAGEGFTAIDPNNKFASGVYTVVGSSNDLLFNQRLIIK